MAQLTHLITHCTATPEGRKVTSDDIIRWHTSPVSMGGRGWKKVGYSDMIYIDGSLINLSPFNQDNIVDPLEITNGAKGMNSRSRHLVYVGGLRIDYDAPLDEDDSPGYMAADTRNEKQKYAMEIYYKYMILRHPQILIAGHYDFSYKACPSFNVAKFCREIGIPEINIYKK
jgi:N-acetylmuramoyl-L-alanine amidase